MILSGRISLWIFVLLVTGAAVFLWGCSESDPATPNKPELATVSGIWPAAEGLFWVYSMESKGFEDVGELYPDRESVPPIPDMETLFAELSNSPTGTVLEDGSGEYRIEFTWGDFPGPETESFLVEKSWKNQSGDDPEVPMPLGFNGKWIRTSDRIYVQAGNDLTWVHLDGSLAPDHEFRVPLYELYTSGIYLETRIRRYMSIEVSGRQYNNCLEVSYVLDMGINQSTDEEGNSNGFFQAFVFGSIIYAPEVGPIYCHEKGHVGPGILNERTATLKEFGESEVIGPKPATVLDSWGGSGSSSGLFDVPLGIAVDSAGTVFVADARNARIQKFSPSGVYLDSWGRNGCTTELNGMMMWPTALTIDSAGQLIVTDNASVCGALLAHVFTEDGNEVAEHRLALIMQGAGRLGGLSVTGDSLTVAIQNRVIRYSSEFQFGRYLGESGSAPGEFMGPIDIDAGPNDSIFIVDVDLDRVTVLDEGGFYVTSWGNSGSGPGEFDRPTGVAIDGQGRVYIADSGNDRVQVFDLLGNLIIMLGPDLSTGGSFQAPYSLALTPEEDLLVLDAGNSKVVKLAGVDDQ